MARGDERFERDRRIGSDFNTDGLTGCPPLAGVAALVAAWRALVIAMSVNGSPAAVPAAAVFPVQAGANNVQS